MMKGGGLGREEIVISQLMKMGMALNRLSFILLFCV
jgi:hypothetical protein